MNNVKDPDSKKIPKAQRYFLGNLPGLIGVSMVLVGLLSGLSIALIMIFAREIPYLDLAFIGVAALVIIGLIAASVGAFMTRRRIKRGLGIKPLALFTLDLNRHSHQISALVTVTGMFFGLAGATSVSYFSLHYVESDAFCSNACHSVMRPEGEAHLKSVHAKVPCVDCHVGSGAGSFLESKLNGLNQLRGIITGNFNRPIQTPVHNMRPARETCESCHWRDRWIGFKDKTLPYYKANDEDNAGSKLRMLIKIGGPLPGGGGEGIHYHMMLGRKVEFVARDRQRQKIAYVKVTEPDGTTKEFNDSEKPLTEVERKSLVARQMDCLDCHNRPAHQYLAPMPAMNIAMDAGNIDVTIPYIKKKGVEVLSQVYETSAEGEEKIASVLTAYYQAEYPEVLTETKAGFDKSVSAIQEVFRKNMFPEMKVRWAAYPDNIGHRDSQGCFRCHNDRMVDADDEPIFTDCKRCHIMIAQGEDVSQVKTDLAEGLAFNHPDDDEDIKEYSDCGECHTGGADTYDE